MSEPMKTPEELARDMAAKVAAVGRLCTTPAAAAEIAGIVEVAVESAIRAERERHERDIRRLARELAQAQQDASRAEREHEADADAAIVAAAVAWAKDHRASGYSGLDLDDYGSALLAAVEARAKQ